MKKIILANLPLLVLGLACGNQNDAQSRTPYYNETSEYQGTYTGAPEEPAAEFSGTGNSSFSDTNEKKGFFSDNSREKGLKTHEFKDLNTGLVVQTTDYPSDWQVISKPVYTTDPKFPLFLVQIQGPDNLKIFNTPLQQYVIYQNQQTNQYMAQFESSAKMMRPLISNQQIIREEVAHKMESNGFRYSGNLQLPELANYLTQKMKVAGNDFNVDFTATVWENNSGTKAMVWVTKTFVHKPVGYNDGFTMWFYRLDYTFAEASRFDETVQQLQDAIFSSKENPQWNQYVQQITNQRAINSQQQFAQNQRNRQAAFDAHQQKMQGMWAAQDANHAAFMERNFGQGADNSHREFINMIREEETVHNPLNGNNYQVEAGAAEYWMDSNGNYIKNNDAYYTPNGDINLNDREWVKVK